MKHIKKLAAVLIVLTLFLTFALGVMADGTKKSSKTTKATEPTSATQTVESSGDSTSSEFDLSKASPEEVEEIGMAAMIEAGLISGSDISIVDVTPEEVSSTDTASQSGVASAFGIAGFVISIVSFVGMCVLYVLCWKKGVFKGNASKRRKAK